MALSFNVSVLELETTIPFHTARAGGAIWHNVLLELTSGGFTGRGEAAPRPFYGESPEKVRKAIIRALRPLASTEELTAGYLQDVGEHSRAAQCALDTARLDLLAQREGMPLHTFLAEQFGFRDRTLPATSMTVGLDEPETMAATATGFGDWPILKIKLDNSRPIETLRAIRSVSEATLRVDGNTAWTANQVLELSPVFEETGVDLLEQPLAATDHAGLEALFGNLPMALYIDESVTGPQDVTQLAGCVDGVNLKLAKCGGPTRTFECVERAREHGLGVMLGCFVESSVAIAAAAALGGAVDHLDLDGSMLLRRDPYQGLEISAGAMARSSAPGLGLVAAPVTSG